MKNREKGHPIISSHYISSRSFRPIHFVPRSFCPVHFVPIILSQNHFVPWSIRPIHFVRCLFIPNSFCLIHYVRAQFVPLEESFGTISLEELPGLLFLGFIFPQALFICWEFINYIKILARAHSSPWSPLSPSLSLELSPSPSLELSPSPLLWSLREIYSKMYGTKWKRTTWFWGKMKGNELNGTKWVWDEMNGT